VDNAPLITIEESGEETPKEGLVAPGPQEERRPSGEAHEAPEGLEARIPKGETRARTEAPLQGFDPLATKHLGNTTHLVAIGGSYDTQTLNW
jgi:hypothetical protein